MKKIITLLIILSFLSCDPIQYDGETKLVIKGVVVDENNQPILNSEVQLIISTSSTENFIFGSSSETNYIGKTKTKSDGSYVMVIPKPTKFGQIVVQTNAKGNLFNEKQFVNILTNNFVNYELTLPQTKLYKKADLSQLNVSTNHLTPNYQLQKLEYIGEVPNEYEMINPYMQDYFELQSQNISVKKNQTIIIKYTVKDFSTNEILVFEENVIIGNEAENNFTLNY